MFPGCSAAILLQEQGLNVLLLEANDRVGGRTHTVQVGYIKLLFGWYIITVE